MLIYAQCLNAISSVFTTQRNYQLDKEMIFAPHLKYLRYLGQKPMFLDILRKEWNTSKMNIKYLPLGRLQYFTRFIEHSGPSILEV